MLDRGRADLERLEEGQRRAQAALDAKNQEVGGMIVVLWVQMHSFVRVAPVVLGLVEFPPRFTGSR